MNYSNLSKIKPKLRTEEEHLAALYDACLLIVNTYNQSDVLDGYTVDNYKGGVTAYDFMKFARSIANNIAENDLH
jgi:tagatose-1,6-bisphosphate aldolase non-catalytic subunit AgaZ/GatZ